MVNINLHKFIKLVEVGIYIFRLFVLPLGLFKVNKEIPDLQEPAGPSPSPSQITIDAEKIVSEIDPRIYGSFIEVLGKCIYQGIWDEGNENVPLLDGLRQDVIEEVRSLKVSNIRFPGGCFADTNSWKNGIGPREDRPVESNKQWKKYGPVMGPKHNNHFGTDEYLQFLKEVNSEAYISINFGSGTPEEAAQWLEYTNGDQSTEYGALRAKNGHPEPYNVKIWGIGNETFGSWETGSRPAEEYAQDYLKFNKKMREIDSSIKFVAVGADFDYGNWSRTVLEVAGKEIDYLSLHVYIPERVSSTLGNTKREFYNIIGGAFEVERRIHWIDNVIAEVMGEKNKIPIALDEWGVIWNTRQHFEGYYTLREGLFAASVFEILHRNSSIVKLANFAQLVNVVPMIVTSQTDIYHNPIYLAHQLFSNYAEQFMVDFQVTTDYHLNPPYGNIRTEIEIPYLGCSVTVNKEKNRLVIIGINRHHAHNINTTISVNNFDPKPAAKVYELNGPSHSAYNYFDKKNEVKIEQKETTSASEFTYTFPAHSVTALILEKK